MPSKKSISSKKLERAFQAALVKELHALFEGCMTFRLNPGRLQGVPDLLILYKDKWATLEVKRSEKARKRPNQDYYVNKMNDMSFSSFIYPENKEEVLSELQRTFES